MFNKIKRIWRKIVKQQESFNKKYIIIQTSTFNEIPRIQIIKRRKNARNSKNK
jgi:hypothetical protein